MAAKADASIVLSLAGGDTPGVGDHDMSMLSLDSGFAEIDAEQLEAERGLRLSLFKFFAAVQSISTAISTQDSEVQAAVRRCVMSSLRTAYLDSAVGQLPVEALGAAWDMPAAAHEEFVNNIIAAHPDAEMQCFDSSSASSSTTDAEQLLVNLSAVAILNHTAALNPPWR